MNITRSRVLTYAYGTAGGINDALSRICSLIDNDGSTHLVDYSYLGQQSFVIADDTEPGVQYTLVSLTGTNDPDTGDIYAGLDRFGRIKDLRWYSAGTSTDVVRIEHGYDRAGNRLWREDPVAASNGKAFDELYTYDGLYRLKDMQRGTLNGTHTAINTGTETFAQCWTLDATGNWNGFREDDTGDGTWDLVQARTANTVNEITAITNSVGSAWAQPAYDPAGNMTTIPQPADPTGEYTATYDAWNMLTKLVDPATSQTVQENRYDGRRFRVARKDFVAGVLSEERHFYYTSGWQSIEERLGSTPDTASPECQYVWGLRYIDDCLLRDRDSDSTGTLDERLYALQDPNWNVVAITDDSGTVQERYAYSAYGVPEFLTATFGSRTTSSFDWETLYCGYRYGSDVGLFHVRNRTYHAILGVWLQLDPLCHVASDGQSSLSGYLPLPPTTPGAVTHIQFSTSDLHYMLEGLHNDIHFNCYFYSRMSPISRVDPMGLACVSYSGPHTGPMDTQYCGWFSRLTGSCCTKIAASNAEQCCAKKGKQVGTCYYSSTLGISVYTCVEVDWECFCPNKFGNLANECRFHNANRKDCMKTKCCTIPKPNATFCEVGNK